MKQINENLYAYYGLEAPEKTGGNLFGWIHDTYGEIGKTRKRPAVLIMPGGSYSFVSDREAEPVAYRFLAKGYVPFVLRYTCNDHTFPVQVREAAMAMRYIREHAAQWSIDPDMVAAVGFSAGGHLCCTLGTMYDCPELADIAPAEVVRPSALGLCYPVIVGWGRTHEGTINRISGGDAALRQRLSLDKQVRSDMPPTFLWHTRDDDLVPCRNSILLAKEMEEKGVDFAFHLYRHGWHGLSLADHTVYGVDVEPGCSPDVPGWLDACVQFWQEIGFHFTDG